MSKKPLTCPRCKHEFIPAPADAKQGLRTLVEAFHNQADGTPRLSNDLHAEFVRWAIADGAAPSFIVSQKWFTNRLLRDHGWLYRAAQDGRRYFPPGDRPWPGRDKYAPVLRLLSDWQAQPHLRQIREPQASELCGSFRRYLQAYTDLPADLFLTDRWITSKLVDVFGWGRGRNTRHRYLIAPPA